MTTPHHSIRRTPHPRGQAQRGSTLIESLVSILLISLAVLALVGMQVQAIRVDSDAQYRHRATLVVTDLANEMLLTQTEKTATDTGPWTEHLAQLPNARLSIVNAPAAEQLSHSWVKDIIVSWMPPNKSGEEREQLTTRLTIPKGSS